MKTYKVNKKVNHKPRIWGLSVNMFYVFLGVVVLAVFIQLGGFTWVRILVGLGFVGIAYIILKVIESEFLDRLNDNSFKENYINDNL